MELYDGALEAYYALTAINVALWLLSTCVLGKTWPVDFIWSSWPIAHALWLITLPDGAAAAAAASPQLEFGGWKVSQLAVLGPVCLWGLRLTANFVNRGGIGHEDWRCKCTGYPHHSLRPDHLPQHPPQVSNLPLRGRF